MKMNQRRRMELYDRQHAAAGAREVRAEGVKLSLTKRRAPSAPLKPQRPAVLGVLLQLFEQPGGVGGRGEQAAQAGARSADLAAQAGARSADQAAQAGARSAVQPAQTGARSADQAAQARARSADQATQAGARSTDQAEQTAAPPVDEAAIRFPAQAAHITEDYLMRNLSAQAAEYGLCVYAFSCQEVLSDHVIGYTLQGGVWVRGQHVLPDLIYDRTIGCARQRDAFLRDLVAQHPCTLLGGGIPGKLEVHMALARDTRIARYLPKTEALTSARQIEAWLQRYPRGIICKPNTGYQGRGVFSVRCASPPQAPPGTLHVVGQTFANQLFSHQFTATHKFYTWLSHYRRRNDYLLQQLLDLQDETGAPFDLRSLVQKDGRGSWTTTGTAVRTGNSAGVTANLCGGGQASDAREALLHRFGAATTADILSQLTTLNLRIAARLERTYGRLCELGIDYGVEPSGQLWLIEVNTKPGHKSFRLDPALDRLSAANPLRYARLLADSQGGRIGGS
jgi:hypothetical protein